MKKILTLICLTVTSAALYGQGLVTFQETSFNILTNGATSGPISSIANSYYFTLFIQQNPTGSTTVPVNTNPLTGGWQWAGSFYGTNGTVGPTIGKIIANGSAGYAIPNWPGTTTNFFLIAGWSANIAGADWLSVSNQIATGTAPGSGYYGSSAAGYASSLDAPAPPRALFGATAGLIQGFTLNQVPEPSTFALVGLGAAALLAFRRRK